MKSSSASRGSLLPQRPLFEIQAYDGNTMGPYTSLQLQHAFLQGRLGLESRVRLKGHMGFKSLATYYHLMDDDLNRPTQLVHELSAGSLLSAQSSGGVGTAASSNPSSYAPAQTSSTSTSPAPTSSSRPSQSDGAQPAASAGSAKPSSESKDVASPQAEAKSETCVTGAGQDADTTKEQASESKAQEGSSTSEQSRLKA